MILHVDMDAFYASVEERDRPELVGKPIVVGGTPEGRGVVAAANYVVRQFGVYSAMPTSTALRLCPTAIVLRPRMGHYAEISSQIRDIFTRYTPLVEPLSLDEAFLDATGSQSLFGTAAEIGRRVKREIYDELRLVASVGVAPNKFLAKLASDLDKPDGFVVVDPQRVQQFLDPLPVGRLWGVGRVTGEKLEHLGVRTIRQLREMKSERLRYAFGEHGEHLWRLAHGQDNRRVTPDREAKSISHESTFASDIDSLEVLRAWAAELAGQVAARLRQAKLRGRTVQLKLRYADFHTVTRAQTLSSPTDVTREISDAAIDMLCHRQPARHLSVRLLGVGVSGLAAAAPVQQMLFGADERTAQTKLDKASDEIRDKFGVDSLNLASGLLHKAKHQPAPRPDP